MSTSRSKGKLIYSYVSKRFKSDNFEVGDYVIITPLKKTVTKKQWLSRPLKDSPTSNVNLNFGKIPHNELIGAVPLGKVHTIETKSKLAKYICSKPSLEQWINLSQRKATPIYAFDAQAIVALADLHLDYPDPPSEEGGKITPLQFLEAGTGHGSLTLAISKALHPANALAHYAKDPNLRGAVLHSIDCNSSHSITGKRTVKGFRKGMYYDNVEFSVAESPSEWVKSEEGRNWMERELVSKKENPELEDTDEPNSFLSGIFLDMPNYHEEMIKLSPYLKTGGFIIAFCPSITQIVEAIDSIAEENEKLAQLDVPRSLHLEHERTIQLLDGAGGGLKEWDTRRALIRATGKVGYSVRPKVGVRSVAGGFVAIWRKLGAGVELEVERDLMENYTGKPVSEVTEEEGISSEEQDSIGNVIEEVATEGTKILGHDAAAPENKTDALDKSTKSDKVPKESMFAPELLSTDNDVLEHERLKSDEGEIDIAEQFPDVDLTDTDSDNFEIQEAKLIPHSVLHTVFRSCHGDPDVHVGYIRNVKVLEFEAPEEFEKETLTEQESASDSKMEPNGESTKEESDLSTNSPKKWTKHSI
ncbi:hypothetical protein CANINC_001068 [Pichia inconspicua]|uniref:tRNA (adenine(58)-N(1))-methyltransferase catalytic subunit TRM61 n=1 Tax=Pichia inconspicua TaxID=52247 RepID=A0A4T0X4J4_9ASCO|nr:hypothetical protein CANINC_001068 [[Candida] inconspicua]